MRKLLLLSVLGLSALVSSARPCLHENPVSTEPGKEKAIDSSNRGKAENQDRGLWILTAKISESSTMQLDTLMSIDAGNLKWTQERHVSIRTVIRGEVTAIFENMADDPENEFWYDSGAGNPGTITVSGDGMHTSHSSYEEIIDGKLTEADISDINVSGSAYPGASIMFLYSPDSKNASVDISINAKGTDKRRRFYDEWKDYSSELDKYGLSCSGGCDVSGDKGCNITKTSTGYQATWRETENRQRHTVNGTEFITGETTLEITIKPYKAPDKPEVTLYGCSELGIGEQGEVMASGKPEGGKFRFWVEPGNMLKVQPDGESSAILTGSTPGRGILYVEYTTPEGKTNQASQQAYCIKIENYNGGQAIPQIPLFDIDGKKLSGVLKVPVSAQPADIEELVDFVTADKSIVSAVGLPDAVELTGYRTGKTTLQAKTNCGDATGPTVEVEVVNCDRQTIEALERMKKAAIENMQTAADALQKTHGSEEFQKAMKDIPGAAQKLVAKAALTIITSGKAPTAAIKTAGELAEAGAAISELVGSATGSELGGNAFKNAVGQLGGELVNTLVGVVEVGEAGLEFGEKLGQILGHENKMKGALENFEQADKNFKEVERLQRICKGNTEEPKKQEPPKTDNPPKPDEPTPTPKDPTPTTKPKPKEDNPPAQEPTPDEPGQPEPPDNPPTTIKPTQVALPYQPSDCGCRKQKAIGYTANEIAKIESGTKNLGDCVDRFTKTSLSDYSDALTELSELTKSLQAGAGEKPEVFLKQAKEAKPQLDSLILRVREYDEAGKTFLGEFEKCPESMKSVMDVLETALTVTVDSIKTKY